MKWLVFLPLILAGCASDARHSGLCGARDIVTASLIRYGESATGAGADTVRNEVVELWQGPDRFSIVSTNRFGASCLISSGRDWRERQ